MDTPHQVEVLKDGACRLRPRFVANDSIGRLRRSIRLKRCRRGIQSFSYPATPDKKYPPNPYVSQVADGADELKDTPLLSSFPACTQRALSNTI
eukprot:scaffold8708_cov157-Skeletonema_marinoi.AAC.2